MRTMPMGPYPVEVALCLSRAEWDCAMRKHWSGKKADAPWPLNDEAATTEKLDFDDGTVLLIAVIQPSIRNMSLAERMGVVAHEAVHLWQYARDHMVIQAVDSEIEAYSVQWYVEWLTEQLHAEGWLKH